MAARFSLADFRRSQQIAIDLQGRLPLGSIDAQWNCPPGSNMSQRKQRVVVFTAGLLQRDVELFLERLHRNQHVDLVAVIVDQWKQPWKRLRFLVKRWGLATFLISLLYRALAMCSWWNFWRRWHDFFVPAVADPTYQRLRGLGIAVRLVDDINSTTAATEIAGFEPDLGVIVGGRILKNRITRIPRLGTLNIHKHDARKYRGSPQIGYPERMNGDPSLGITIHFATSQVDQGDVVSVTQIPIERLDDDRSLRIKASVHGMNAYLEAIEAVATGSHTRHPQVPTSGETYVTTPLVDRVRFWRKYRRAIDAAIARPRVKRLESVARFVYRSTRFVTCMALLPWLAHRRRKHEMAGTAPIVFLYYHGVGNGGENWMTWPLHRLHEDLSYLQKYYKIISIQEAVERLRSGVNHETAAVLTFDDGYQSCHHNLLPYLNYYRIPGTIFACPGASSAGSLHQHDLHHGCGKAALMTAEQLAQAARSPYVEIGSHGNFHEDMGQLFGQELEHAITGSGDHLARISNEDVRYFSFPFGKKHHMSVEALRHGRRKYDAMFSAYGGYNFPDPENRFHFQRIANPISLSSMVAIMSGLHRFRPFYVDRPAAFSDGVPAGFGDVTPAPSVACRPSIPLLRRRRLRLSLGKP